MIRLLNDIASIHTGVFAKTSGEGDTFYLQASHYDEFGQFNDLVKPNLKMDKKIERHLLMPGYVLFAAKGFKNFAITISHTMPQAVASTTFFVIKINAALNGSIMPEYLTWYLNNPETQKMLKASAIGSSLPSISKEVLQSLQVPVPSGERQQTILEIHKLHVTEKKLKQRIESLKELHIQQTLLQATKAETIHVS